MGTGGTGGLGTGGATTTGAAGATTSTGTGGNPVFIEVSCQNHVYECGDTIDNDGDGTIDWQDPDCLGPCDNTENSYYGGIPGQSGPNCDVDCYWDSNSGSGNDSCFWNHKCDTNEQMEPGHPEPTTKCAYDPNTNISGSELGCDELYATQSDTCGTICGPLTPNGCDCFGCCELPAGSGKYIWLGSEDEATGDGSCTVDVIDDVTKCEPCVPVQGCLNGCDHCELCIGKPELPDDCLPGGTGGGGGAGGGGQQQCNGQQPCGLSGQEPCPASYYCITGCCQPAPP
jgi:hypothetical protein